MQPISAGFLLGLLFYLEAFPSLQLGFLLGLLFYPEDRSDVALKRRNLFDLHGVTTQRTVLSIMTGVRTENPISNTLQI
jgi:hypothetical protein